MNSVTVASNLEKPPPPAVRVVVNVSAAAGFRPGPRALASPGEYSFKQSQALLKQRLGRGLLDLFQQLTGTALHLWWHQPAATIAEADLPKLCPQARQALPTGLPPGCRECLRKRWLPEWTGLRSRRQFVGLCGTTNFYASLKHRGRPILTLLVQQPTPNSPESKRAFTNAVRLAQLIGHDLRVTLQAGLGMAGADRPEGASPHPANGNHREQLVQRMLEYIHHNYSRSIQLQDLADAMKLNASYVSFLFSGTLGVTFHHYLEQVRLSRAKDLLRDPIRRVSEVARAVGYPNPHYFRNVFAARVGLPPSAWRQTAAGVNLQVADAGRSPDQPLTRRRTRKSEARAAA